MAGAVIPDDWDGSTFKCNRIQWPSSEQWEAILLGQMTEAARETYWDPETGDPGPAAKAAKDGYLATIDESDIWLKECDEFMNVPAFRVHKNASQVIPSSVWTVITWEAYWHDSNNPGFILAQEAHSPNSVDLMGLWNYEVNIALDTSAQMFVRTITSTGSVTVATGAAAPDGTFAQGFDVDWSFLQPALLRTEILIPGGASVILNPEYTNWQGHYLGIGGA